MVHVLGAFQFLVLAGIAIWATVRSRQGLATGLCWAAAGARLTAILLSLLWSEVIGRAGSGMETTIATTHLALSGLNFLSWGLLLEGMARLIPSAEVGFVGMVRDEETLEPFTYAERLPADLSGRQCYVLDPMLATGGSLAGTVQFLIKRGADHITCICLIAAPEGIARMRELLDQVQVPCTLVVAAVDEHLNEVGYIVPGLGDAGDRLYGLAE